MHPRNHTREELIHQADLGDDPLAKELASELQEALDYEKQQEEDYGLEYESYEMKVDELESIIQRLLYHLDREVDPATRSTEFEAAVIEAEQI